MSSCRRCRDTLTPDMFASASTFKVELDECSKILREAGPKSFVILDGAFGSMCRGVG